jgi:hypothetical protein
MILLMTFLLLLLLMLTPLPAMIPSTQWLQRSGASATLVLFLALALLVPADSLPNLMMMW